MKARRHKRYHIKLPISFVGNQGVGEGTIFNLSEGGCAIESGHDVQVGDAITLRLYIPTDKQPVQITQAGVTWRAGSDFGVEFVQMDPEHKERLNRVLAGLAQQSGTA